VKKKSTAALSNHTFCLCRKVMLLMITAVMEVSHSKNERLKAKQAKKIS